MKRPILLLSFSLLFETIFGENANLMTIGFGRNLRRASDEGVPRVHFFGNLRRGSANRGGPAPDPPAAGNRTSVPLAEAVSDDHHAVATCRNGRSLQRDNLQDSMALG